MIPNDVLELLKKYSKHIELRDEDKMQLYEYELLSRIWGGMKWHYYISHKGYGVLEIYDKS